MPRPCRHRRGLTVLLAVSLLAACNGDGPAPATAQRAAPLDTIAITAGGAEGERLFDGVVEAVQQATLVAQTSGRVVALERDVDDPVASGGLILRIAGVEQRARLDEAQQALAGAEAVAIEARASYERTQELVERRLLSQADLDRATAARDAAEARLAAARAGVTSAREQYGYTEVRAPFAGVVTRRDVEVGEAVSPGQPLTAVAALGALRVNVDVPQTLADGVRQQGTARVHAGGRVVESARLTVFPAAESTSNTVRVRVDLPAGTDGLYPGMFVKAGFRSGEDLALRVPAAAIVRRSEVTAVYVVADNGRPQLRQVRLGRQLGEEFEVLAGLSVGERIARDPIAATLAIEGH